MSKRTDSPRNLGAWDFMKIGWGYFLSMSEIYRQTRLNEEMDTYWEANHPANTPQVPMSLLDNINDIQNPPIEYRGLMGLDASELEREDQ